VSAGTVAEQLWRKASGEQDAPGALQYEYPREEGLVFAFGKAHVGGDLRRGVPSSMERRTSVSPADGVTRSWSPSGPGPSSRPGRQDCSRAHGLPTLLAGNRLGGAPDRGIGEGNRSSMSDATTVNVAVQEPKVCSVRIGRQGIYDRQRNLVAYELLFRAHGSDSADLRLGPEQDRATSQVISTTFGDFGAEQLAGDKLLFLNLTRGFFVGELPMPCPPHQVVLELLEHVVVDEAVLAGMIALQQQGYRIAVDDFDGEVERLPAVAIADVVKLDAEASGDRLAGIVDLVRAHNPTALIVVERIEDDELFDRCSSLGVDLFQGYGLQRPTVLEAVRLSPSQVVVLRLVRALSTADASMDEIEALVASDPGLSFRVLKTVSSAAYTSRAQITSLRQALVLLGRRELCSWLVLMLLGGVTTQDTQFLVRILTRAGCCARLVPTGPDLAYTAGLLSAVAPVLGIPVQDLLRTVGVGPDLRAAVLENSGVVGSALSAVIAHEEENVPGVVRAGYDVQEVSRVYLEALADAMRTATTLGER